MLSPRLVSMTGLIAAALTMPAQAFAQPLVEAAGTIDAAGNYYEGPASGSPASPGPQGMIDPRPEWPGDAPQPQRQSPAPVLAQGAPGAAQTGFDRAAFERAKADWLQQCNRNLNGGKLVGGAPLGSLGAHGARTASTGTPDPRAWSEYCSAYLNYHIAQQGQAYEVNGMQVMLVPLVSLPVIALAQGGVGAAGCTETSEIEESDETAPADKRIRIR